MKALGLVVSDKKIFEKFISETYLLTPWPTYSTNWNGLNNFDRGPLRDHSCEVWSKSNKRLQRRCCLKKLLTDGRTDGRRTPDIEGSQKLTEHYVLRWAKKFTHDGQRPVTIAQPKQFVLRWAKNSFIVYHEWFSYA